MLFCYVYPTAPFVTADKLRKAYSVLERTGADAVLPVVKIFFPPQRCFVMDGNYMHFKWKEYELSRSRDLEPMFHDAGQFYFIKSDIMKEQRTMIPSKTIPLIMDEMEVQDIGNLGD